MAEALAHANTGGEPDVATLSLNRASQAMDAPENLAKLVAWTREYGAHLRSDVDTSYSEEQGAHLRAKSAIDSPALLAVAPHSIALSHLNALVDDAYPVFKQRRNEFGGVENIGFFYLMTQYINLNRSFWRPYLVTLPQPTHYFTTPLWFDSNEDLLWIEETDVLFSTLARKAIYEQYYKDGVNILRKAGIDTESYTWDLFRWAVTIFSSRSFSSRAVTPQESKYWTAYKGGAPSRRQTVLMDMSHVPSQDLDFPVLFPLLDVANHSHNAHVDWSFDPGRFSITLNDSVKAGAEVFNNYGTKGNDELFLGYGFCVQDSMHDSVMLTLKPPPEELQVELRKYHPGYFKMPDKTWNSEKATFRVKHPSALTESPDPGKRFDKLPTPLLELLTYNLRYERGLSFIFYEQPLEYLTSADGSRYLPHVARMIVQSLTPKLIKLEAIEVPSAPQNERQRQASIYRTGQLDILRATIAGLKDFTRSMLRPSSALGSRFVTLEGFIERWQHCSGPSSQVVEAFLTGMEVNSGTSDPAQLRGTGWEEDIFVLAICAAVLEAGNWTMESLPEYVRIQLESLKEHTTADAADDPEEEGDADGRGLMEIVRTAAAGDTMGENIIWRDVGWSDALIDIIGKMLLHDGMTMMVPSGDAAGREEARFVVYFHAQPE